MKRSRLQYLLLLALFSFQIFYSQEIDEKRDKVEYDICADVNSQYLWRGISSSNGFVVQPCVSAGYRNFSMYVWGNFEPGIKEGKKFNEVDVSIGYSKEFRKLTVEPSVLFYIFPGVEDASTGEFILKLTHPLYKELSIFTSHNFDIIRYKGSYYGDAGLSLEHLYSDNVSISGASGIGWSSVKFNETYNEISKSAVNLVYINASVVYNLSEYFYIQPKAEVQFILDKELKEASDKNTLFNIGITLGTAF